MNCSIIVATCGDPAWAELAARCGACSAHEQPATEVIVHHGSGTIAEARNAAAMKARADWLCFLDADDELAPGYLDAMKAAELRARDDLGLDPYARLLLGPSAEWVRWSGQPKYRGQLGPMCDLREANWLVIGTLVQREVFYEVGGFKEWPVYEDWDLWQRCMIAGAVVYPVPEALYVAWTRPGSRNRSHQMRWKNEIHHQIRSTNYPELYQ